MYWISLPTEDLVYVSLLSKTEDHCAHMSNRGPARVCPTDEDRNTEDPCTHSRTHVNPRTLTCVLSRMSTERPRTIMHTRQSEDLYMCVYVPLQMRTRSQMTEIKCIYTGAYNQKHLLLGVIGGSKTNIQRFVKCGPGLSFSAKIWGGVLKYFADCRPQT